jgi:transketolase
MRAQFRNTVTDLAAQDDRLVVVFGDISVYMFKEFGERYPGRFYNMGICENTLVSVTAGLSSQGYHTFVSSSTCATTILPATS